MKTQKSFKIRLVPRQDKVRTQQIIYVCMAIVEVMSDDFRIHCIVY